LPTLVAVQLVGAATAFADPSEGFDQPGMIAETTRATVARAHAYAVKACNQADKDEAERAKLEARLGALVVLARRARRVAARGAEAQG
jgi:hypothetical protein